MIAAYVRVSSRGQDHASQRAAIERAAAARGECIERWFAEKQSGSKLDRPALAELRELVRRGEVTRLYVFRLDRLSRTGIRHTLGLLEELRGAGCRVVTLADGFELEGPFAEVVIAVIAWAAQMERAALGERISAARTRVEASGRTWGRPRRVPEAKVTAIRAMAARPGASIRRIAIAHKVSRSTVAAVLSEKGAYASAPATTGKTARKKNQRGLSE